MMCVFTLHVYANAVADPEFYNGGKRSRERGLGRGLCPLPRKKIEFLPETGGFWCIRITFYVYAKIGQVNEGAAALPAPLESATAQTE